MLQPSRYAPGTLRFDPRVDAELTPIPPRTSHEQQPAVEAQASGQDRSAQPPARAQAQGCIEQDDARTGLVALPRVRAASSRLSARPERPRRQAYPSAG